MPTKRAVIIGIDRYEHLGGDGQLRGCVNDARLVRSVLTDSYGFPESQVRLLLDGEATRDGILGAWHRLAEQTEEDDIVVLHYSGHGSWCLDTDGDEGDGRDETIMPSDSGRGPSRPNRDIVDDEVNLLLAQLARRTSNVTLVFDSCHSGSITRAAPGTRARGMPGPSPGDPLPPVSPDARRSTEGAFARAGPSGWLPLSDRYLLISACRDEEVAWEHVTPQGVHHGALTYHLYKTLHEARAGTTFRDVFETVASAVRATGRQHPQMEGTLDRVVFGSRDHEAGRYLSITARGADTVTLAGGAAHGLTIGSRWHVQRSGPIPDDESPGEVTVVEVGAVTSTARIVAEPSGGPVRPGLRATETAHSFGDFRLGVYLAPAPDGPQRALATLVDRVEASPLLKRVDTAGEADIWLAVLASAESESADAMSHPEDEDVVLARSREGELTMPPKRADDPELVDNLEKAARYKLALGLRNPTPPDHLRARVTVELLRRRPDDRWVPARSSPSGGLPEFEEGDEITFSVTNRTGRDLFLTVVDFGLSGGVARLYPPRGAEERLTSSDDPHQFSRFYWELAFPDVFPWNVDGAIGAPEHGTEVFKFFLSTAPADLGILEQDSFRRSRSPLELLWRTAIGGPTRDILDLDGRVDNDEDWFTVEKAFVLKRRSQATVEPAEGRVRLGTTWISTRAATVRASAHGLESDAAASRQLQEEPLRLALERAGVRSMETLELALQAGADGRAEVTLEVPRAGPAFEQVVLSSDEGGVMTWHFPQPPEPGTTARGGFETDRFLLSGPVRTTQDPEAAPVGRGLLGAVGKRFIRILAFRVLDEALEEFGRFAINRFEEARRPYRVRTFTPDDYREEHACGLVDALRWERLAQGRSLLMIHGTNSRSSMAFQCMPREYVAELGRRYEDRVFALDHFTFSHTPEENVDWLISQLPDGCRLDVDIVCHSRGGLVSRALLGRQRALAGSSRALRVGKVVFAGSPNGGTALADARHVGRFLDVYTNLLNFFPDNGITDAIEAIVYAVKTFAVAGAQGLPGLQSMVPGGDFLRRLRATEAGARFFGLASDYEPREPTLKSWAADALADQVFLGARNDLVVPTESVFGSVESGLPMEDRLVFAGDDAVGHSGYFCTEQARRRMLQWLDS